MAQREDPEPRPITKALHQEPTFICFRDFIPLHMANNLCTGTFSLKVCCLQFLVLFL